MDAELIRLLQAVVDGKISGDSQARRIIADGREEIEALSARVSEFQDLLFRAEQAFVAGWPTRAPL
jgi:hypothetical protein